MKLVFSRKGFDSAAGGMPSPILPDGRLVSLPILDSRSRIRYGDITSDGRSLGPLVDQLSDGRVRSHWRAHLDPDLVRESLLRSPGWRPLFGQAGAAQGHLRNHGVGPGDLFLFFGLFRQVELVGGAYAWAKGLRPCHVLWGWLQIGEALELGPSTPAGYAWAAYHPHFRRGRGPSTVHVASRELTLRAIAAPGIPGAGAFARFSPRLRLTATLAQHPSTCDLPSWFYPTGNRTPLTYHADPERWRMLGQRTELRAAARGQEFVLDGDEYPEAVPWACDLLETEERRS